MTQRIQIFLFGTPRIEYADQVLKLSRRKGLALLAYLVVNGRSQSRETLATLLWPEFDQKQSLTNLRSTLSPLKKLSPLDWMQINRSSVAVDDDLVWVDVLQFQRLIALSQKHRHADLETSCDTCLAQLELAIALYKTDFLAGFTLNDSSEFDDWQLLQRESLQRQYRFALQQLVHLYIIETEWETAVSYAQQWLTVDPLNEQAHRTLIELYAQSNRQTDALRQYKRCTQILENELGISPSSETQQLYEQIKTQKTKFAKPIPTNNSIKSILPPLPSLVVGRQQTIEAIKRQLGIPNWEAKRPITLIQGWPGVGKSTITAVLAHDATLNSTFSDGVLWTSLGQNPDLLAILTQWGKALGLPAQTLQPSVTSLSHQLIATLHDKKMLLIIDDVWRTSDAQPFHIGGQNCATIFSTRRYDVAQALAPTPADIHRLNVLSDNASLQLLQQLAPEIVNNHVDQANELIRDLAGLPLAIQVAGRLLHNEARLGWGIEELLEELREGAKILTTPAPNDVSATEELQTSPTIATLLQYSTDRLSEDMRDHLAYLGIFAPKPATFDLEAMAETWAMQDPRPVARTLVNRGFLEPVGNGRFQMHPILVLHARSLLAQAWE